MRNKRLRWTILIIFVGINCLLVWLDDGEKLDRAAYIKTWGNVYQTDLQETIEADGVIANSGETYVYFDKSLGSFDRFLVEEGSVVNIGDPLFQYRVQDFSSTEQRLSFELEKVNSEISAIENAISEMVAFRIQSPSVPVLGDGEKDNTTVIVTPQEPVEAEVLKEQFIIQKKQELTVKEEQAKVIQSQLNDLLTTGDLITVESPFQGRVTVVSSTLNDPIIQIENSTLLVKGDVREAERKELQLGQTVEIMLRESEESLVGTISQVADEPYEVHVNKESVYPFKVSFDEGIELDSVLAGYHADLIITVDESIQATAIHERFVNHHHVWKLNDLGRLELVPVQTGIQQEDQLEVINGLAVGNVVTDQSLHSSYNGATIITPLKFSDVAWLDIGKYKDWLLYMTVGMLTR